LLKKDELPAHPRGKSAAHFTATYIGRIQGRQRSCTHIGNDLFASFSTTDSKSRLNPSSAVTQPEETVSALEEARLASNLRIWRQIPVEGRWFGGTVSGRARKLGKRQLAEWGITNETHCRQLSEAAVDSASY